MTAPSRGWSTTTARMPWRPHRDELLPLLRAAEFSAPEEKASGKVDRECWHESGWHLGLERSISTADGEPIFRGAAEHELRGIFVRWPVAVVDEVRARICPDVQGRSE